MTTTSPIAGQAQVSDVQPDLLERWLADGTALLVDVREDFEYAEESIGGAELMPLSGFDADELRRRHPDERIVFHCRTGKRSLDAASRFLDGEGPAFHLAGGLEAWKASGRPTNRSASAPKIGVMRQVQMIAGFLVTLGVALGVLVSPWFLALSAFVGVGLMFAGASGWCGMAMLLAKMPWNRGAPGCSGCQS